MATKTLPNAAEIDSKQKCRQSPASAGEVSHIGAAYEIRSKSMHVFVTGASGNVASHVIPDLIAAGHEVTGLARSDKAADAVSALGARVRRGDLADLRAVEAAAAETDGVSPNRLLKKAW